MLKDNLAAVAASIGFEAKDSFIAGTYKGFGLTVKAVEEQSCCIINFFARKGALTNKTAEVFLDEYKAQNSFIKAVKVDGFVIRAVYSCAEGEDICISRTLTVIEDTISFLMMNYYSNVCAKCGSAIGLCFSEDKQLCKSCLDSMPVPTPTENIQAAPTENIQVAPVVAVDTSTAFNNTQPTDMTANGASLGAAGFGVAAAGFGMAAAGAGMMSAANPGMMSAADTAPMGGNATNYNEIYNADQANNANSFNVTPTPNDQRTPELMTAPDYMGTVGLDTNPESTGYATKESLAAIPMPARNIGDPMAMTTGDFSYNQAVQPVGMYPQQTAANGYAQPMSGENPPMNDFRADESYYNAPPIYGNVYNRPTKLEPESSNVPLGLLGAFIFSLIGCAAWILVGKLGYVSMWCGLLLSFLCTFGYKKLGKKFDIFGFIICGVLIALEVLACNILIETWSICENEMSLLVARVLGFDGFGDIFFGWFDFMNRFDSYGFTDELGKELSITFEFVKDLGLSYLFSFVLYIIYGISAYKNDKQ